MTTPPTPPTDNLAAESGPRSEMSERRCLTPCDDDCPVACHEVHQVTAKRGHGVRQCIADQCMTAEREGLAEEEFVYAWAPTTPVGRRAMADALADLLAARDRRVRAEALREAADDASKVAAECEGTYRESYRPYDQGVADAWDAAADGLRDRADRIEGEG